MEFDSSKCLVNRLRSVRLLIVLLVSLPWEHSQVPSPLKDNPRYSGRNFSPRSLALSLAMNSMKCSSLSCPPSSFRICTNFRAHGKPASGTSKRTKSNPSQKPETAGDAWQWRNPGGERAGQGGRWKQEMLYLKAHCATCSSEIASRD